MLPSFSPCGRRWREAPDQGSLSARTVCACGENPSPVSNELRSFDPPSPTRGEGRATSSTSPSPRPARASSSARSFSAWPAWPLTQCQSTCACALRVIEPLPEVVVLDRLLVGGLPAVLLPAVDPAR